MDANAAVPLVRSFERHLRAANRAPTTVANYLHAVRQAHRFLAARGITLEAASRADLEAFMADLLARREPSTAATYHKVLKILYAWLVEEGEIPSNPTVHMRPPINGVSVGSVGSVPLLECGKGTNVLALLDGDGQTFCNGCYEQRFHPGPYEPQ
jgi:site-specific recombinase XerD